MIDKQTKDEAKEVLLDTIKGHGCMRLEDLVATFERGFVEDGIGRVQALLTEMAVAQLVTEVCYRLPPALRLRSVYFPAGVHTSSSPGWFLRKEEMAERVLLRPPNFQSLDHDQQWAVDKVLGILDWDGT